MFSIILETNFIFNDRFILSYAKAFSLDQSKSLSFGKELTRSETTNFRLFQIEKICRRQFYFAGNGRRFFKQVENTVGKEEIARYKQFLLFPQCVQKTCIADT